MIEEVILKMQDSVLKWRPGEYCFEAKYAAVLEKLISLKSDYKFLTRDQLFVIFSNAANLNSTLLDRLLNILASWVIAVSFVKLLWSMFE